jgi:hypothetical protein
MVFGLAINRAEERNPQQTERAGDQERGTPSARDVVDPIREEGRDGAADRRAAIEERDSPSAFGSREPFRDSLGRAGSLRSSISRP